METVTTSCTECSATRAPAQVLCSRCHRAGWHTLKKVSACLLVVALLAILIRYMVNYGDRRRSAFGLDERPLNQSASPSSFPRFARVGDTFSRRIDNPADFCRDISSGKFSRLRA